MGILRISISLLERNVLLYRENFQESYFRFIHTGGITMKHLSNQDKQVFEAIQLELGRQRGKIELIASENFVSEAVMEAQDLC